MGHYGMSCSGGKVGTAHYLAKLAAADGSEVWKKTVPHALKMCTAINDGSIFCSYTMSSSDGALDFGDGITMPAVVSTMTGVVKFNSAGVTQWAKVTHAAAVPLTGGLAVNELGTALVIIGKVTGSPLDLLSRIDTSAGNEGNILWTDTGGGGGTHGFRGVQVSNDGTQVTTFGQINVGAPLTLTDSLGSATTVTSHGSYTIFVAAYDGATGTGKWAMDAGSEHTDYFFAFGIDYDTNDIFVGGAVYGTPREFKWGDVKRKNAQRQYKAGEKIGSYGDTKGFTVQIKSTTTPPSCLTNTCSAAAGPQASDVKPDMCYIDRHCYNKGDFSPYPGQECKKCDPTTSAGRMAWSAPDTTSMCFIGGKCVAEGTGGPVPYSCMSRGRPSTCYKPDPCNKCIPSVSGTAYSPVAEKGCMVSTTHALAQRPPLPRLYEEPCCDELCCACRAQLDMATFTAACYDDQGNMTMTETDKVQLMADKASMTTTVATRDATITTHANTIKDLETSNIQMAADLKTAKADNDGEKMPTWAVAIIVVIGAMFLLVLMILGVVVSR